MIKYLPSKNIYIDWSCYMVIYSSLKHIYFLHSFHAFSNILLLRYSCPLFLQQFSFFLFLQYPWKWITSHWISLIMLPAPKGWKYLVETISWLHFSSLIPDSKKHQIMASPFQSHPVFSSLWLFFSLY